MNAKRAAALAVALVCGGAAGAGARWWLDRTMPAREAAAARRAGDEAGAARWAELALRAAPEDPALLSLLARGREREGDARGAEQALGRIVQWTDDDRLTAARLARRIGAHVRCETEARKLLDTPVRAEALRLCAWAATRRGDSLAAAKLAEQAAAAGEPLPALELLVEAQINNRETEAALGTVRKMQAEPGWPALPSAERQRHALMEMRLLLLLGRVADALDAAAKWPPELAGQAAARGLAGQAKFQSGNLAEAEQDLMAAIGVENPPLDAVLDLAELLLRKNDPRQALELLDRARVPDPPPRRAVLLERARAQAKQAK